MNVREVLNAIFYVLWTGCPWKALPKDLPPRSTVWEYLDLWDWDGTLGRTHHALYVEVREKAGREASPTTAIMDSQSVKGGRQRGASLDPVGYDAGKTVLGRKRPILTDTLGLLLAVIVHPAPVQDRDGAKTLLREARRSFPFIARIIADAGDQGRKTEAAVARTGRWERQIVRRCDRPRFGVLPKRWIVEVVFTQMTKADVLALGARWQHVADLDLGVGDDHAVDEQPHELPALLKGRRGQPVLHPRAERLR